MPLTHESVIRRIHRELLDHSDEELELELLEDVRNLDELFDEHADVDEEKLARRRYFSELFRLQGELVKLQSWVVKTGHKVVILFEGRDAVSKQVFQCQNKPSSVKTSPPVSKQVLPSS